MPTLPSRRKVSSRTRKKLIKRKIETIHPPILRSPRISKHTQDNKQIVPPHKKVARVRFKKSYDKTKWLPRMKVPEDAKTESTKHPNIRTVPKIQKHKQHRSGADGNHKQVSLFLFMSVLLQLKKTNALTGSMASIVHKGSIHLCAPCFKMRRNGLQTKSQG